MYKSLGVHLALIMYTYHDAIFSQEIMINIKNLTLIDSS